jgi:hypothetical protein
VRLAALRGEVVAFQIVVEAGDAALDGVTVDLAGLAPGGAPKARAVPAVERFVEHYVEVRSRSKNDRRPPESLAWSPAARPPDALVRGLVPDALVPVALAQPWCPYPLAVAPRTTAAVWFDVTVPPDAAPGAYAGDVVVRSGARPLATLPVELSVDDAVLPYRPVSFFVHYDPIDELDERIGPGTAPERQLWQLLHRHHVDALARLSSPADAKRLASALDGSLFTPSNGYDGPGEGVAPAVAAVGTYGALGEPRPEALATVEAIAPLVPKAVEDLFVYAVDEQCDSPRGPGWRRLLGGAPGLSRVRAGHTCSEDPSGQDVDLVMMAADHFDELLARAARAQGKTVWIYNGRRPQTGAFALDAPPTDPRAAAWIAATRDVGRWFLWESTFWNDSNHGGHGPIDPFTTAESFHNGDGDRMLFDGLLLYPGTQRRYPARSLGVAGVLPSIRLKNLRRGIEDAGYLALARAAHPAEADAIALRMVPEALEEIAGRSRPSWPEDGAAWARARRELRALIRPGAALDRAAAAEVLRRGAQARTPARAKSRRELAMEAGAGIAVGAMLALAVGVALALARGRRRGASASVGGRAGAALGRARTR